MIKSDQIEQKWRKGSTNLKGPKGPKLPKMINCHHDKNDQIWSSLQILKILSNYEMAGISKNKLSQQKTLSLSRAKNVPTFIDIPGIQQESRRPLIQEKALGQIWRLPQKKKKRNAGKSLFSHFILKIRPQYTGEPFKALGNFSLCRSKKLMEKCCLHFYKL